MTTLPAAQKPAKDCVIGGGIAGHTAWSGEIRGVRRPDRLHRRLIGGSHDSSCSLMKRGRCFTSE